MTVRIRVVGTIVGATTLVVFGAPAAFAQTWTASTDGSSVVFNNNTANEKNNVERFHLCDTDADGHSVYVEYEFGAISGTDEWSGGSGTCYNFDHKWSEGVDGQFKVCENINNWPDDCSDWKDATT